MSQQNVEEARRASRDLHSLFEAFADDIVWDNRDYGAETPPEFASVVRGKAPVERMIRAWVGTWDDFRFEVQDVIDAGHGVVVVVRETGRGRRSGVPMRHDYCQLWRIEDRQISQATAFASKADAMRAAREAE
jgi:ketosteroid isomerase-like protein